MKIFKVDLKKEVDNTYEIIVGWDLFERLICDLKDAGFSKVDKFALITDSMVSEIYGKELFEQLKENQFNVHFISFPAGEISKTRETKIYIENRMIEEGFGRDSCVIALGGGVVSDIAGFVAGTYARGIPFINYATTLLAAADASVGGKTAVDTPHATNLIGLFHQPEKVYIDLSMWKTLSKRHICNGLVETIKHAIIADDLFFNYLEENIDKVITLNRDTIEYIAYKNCEIKYRIVQADEHESNLRQVLNLGHTIGRALEAICDYRMYHGEAVAVGLVLQAKLALKYGYINSTHLKRIVNLFKKLNLPVSLPSYINKDELVNKIYTDKKVRKSNIKFVFQSGIGSMMQFEDGDYSKTIEESEIYSIIE
ncbi:3-dehydroquinate synthase [Spirochaeta cellobiosiphila]|uniref:3-dehydroquinate synthase n=1 Tax=Spirochaeta cellobiosiphila TaxID=504483 RepID=UPI0003F8DC29|nr:3-dehydroquinate synthase [Spirochaeta cellobiosiphila]